MAPRPVPHSFADDVDLLLSAELLAPAARRTSRLSENPGLELCSACELPFVVPGTVHGLVGPDRVRLDLHCTNCGDTRTAVLGEAELILLDQQVDGHVADLLWTLELVWLANEEAAIDAFVRALATGAILPEDF